MKNISWNYLLIIGIVLLFGIVGIWYFADQKQGITEIKLYKPWILNSEHLESHFVVAKKLTGSCWTASTIDPRPDAWRCMAGNQILDPCFSPNPLTKTVACSSSPWAKKITLIHLTKALPIAEANSDDFMQQNPWILVLPHGMACYPIGGATFGFAGMRNDYSCREGGLLFGPVICNSSVCKVFYYQPEHPNLMQKVVEEVWY